MSIHYTFELVGKQIHVTREEIKPYADPKLGYDDKAFRDNWTEASQQFIAGYAKARPQLLVFLGGVKGLHEEFFQISVFAQDLPSLKLLVVPGMDDAMVEYFNKQTQEGRRIGITNELPGTAKLLFADSRTVTPASDFTSLSK